MLCRWIVTFILNYFDICWYFFNQHSCHDSIVTYVGYCILLDGTAPCHVQSQQMFCQTQWSLPMLYLRQCTVFPICAWPRVTWNVLIHCDVIYADQISIWHTHTCTCTKFWTPDIVAVTCACMSVCLLLAFSGELVEPKSLERPTSSGPWFSIKNCI